ncbi:MAG: SDR family oxidoreductase [Marinifilaceae bacterium]
MHNKVAIVTGASSGIGKALVFELVQQGVRVVQAARSLDKLQETEKELSNTNAEILSIQADVTQEVDCKRIIDKTVEQFGQIDILINNAGISMRALLDDVDTTVLKQVMDVNFWGTVYCTKHALPYIQKSHGSIVGIISIAGYLGLPGRTGYSASKFAVRGFLDTIRVENLKKGIHVMIAAPGFTASNIRKVALAADGNVQGESPRDESKMMSAERCAQIIVKGIRNRKREIIMTLVEGKIAVFLSKWWPSLLDKLNYNHMAKEPNSPFK